MLQLLQATASDALFLWLLRTQSGSDAGQSISSHVFRGVSHYDVHLIGEDLRHLLNEHPATRHALPDLAHLERCLRLGGRNAIDRIEPRRLRWALSQLLSLGNRAREGPLAKLTQGLEAVNDLLNDTSAHQK